MTELLGAAIAVAAAVFYDAGYILEKQALTAIGPTGTGPMGLIRAAAGNGRWRVGFGAMLAGLGLQVVALTMAPVSVVQPILAGGLIALAAAGSSFLGETLNARHRAALAMVVLAVGAVGLSARGGSTLARSVAGDRFTTIAVVALALAALAARAGLGSGVRGRLSPTGLVGTALGAGLLYGLGALAEKAVATRIVRLGFVHGAVSALASPYPWVFAVATLAGMVLFQAGLQANPASLMASLANVTSTVCALVGSSVVFGERALPVGWWSLLRGLGLACVVASVALLAVDGELEASGVGGQDAHGLQGRAIPGEPTGPSPGGPLHPVPQQRIAQ